jgi:hypothetical protein
LLECIVMKREGRAEFNKTKGSKSTLRFNVRKMEMGCWIGRTSVPYQLLVNWIKLISFDS